MLAIIQNWISSLQRQSYIIKIPYAKGDDGGKKRKREQVGKWALSHFLMDMEAHPSRFGQSLVRIFCGDSFPSAYTWQIHKLDLREKWKGKSWGFRSQGIRWGARRTVSLLTDLKFFDGQEVNQRERMKLSTLNSDPKTLLWIVLPGLKKKKK